jgi:hypothetical protein
MPVETIKLSFLVSSYGPRENGILAKSSFLTKTPLTGSHENLEIPKIPRLSSKASKTRI